MKVFYRCSGVMLISSRFVPRIITTLRRRMSSPCLQARIFRSGRCSQIVLGDGLRVLVLVLRTQFRFLEVLTIFTMPRLLLTCPLLPRNQKRGLLRTHRRLWSTPVILLPCALLKRNRAVRAMPVCGIILALRAQESKSKKRKSFPTVLRRNPVLVRVGQSSPLRMIGGKAVFIIIVEGRVSCNGKGTLVLIVLENWKGLFPGLCKPRTIGEIDLFQVK